MNQPMELATGLAIAMTTAPRRAPTLTRALTSLRAAGFGEVVHVFAEPGTFAHNLQPIDARTIIHGHTSTLGCFGNWSYALRYLQKKISAKWLMVVQDDAIWSQESADVLRAQIVARQNQPTGFLS